MSSTCVLLFPLTSIFLMVESGVNRYTERRRTKTLGYQDTHSSPNMNRRNFRLCWVFLVFLFLLLFSSLTLGASFEIFFFFDGSLLGLEASSSDSLDDFLDSSNSFELASLRACFPFPSLQLGQLLPQPSSSGIPGSFLPFRQFLLLV